MNTEPTPCNKSAYSTKADAVADAKLLQSSQRQGRAATFKSNGKMTPYQCKVCGEWHLSTASGSRSKKLKQRDKRRQL